METGLRILLLTIAASLGCGGCAVIGGGSDAGEDTGLAEGGTSDDEPAFAVVYEPDVETREVREARIDTENFEFGGFGGFMNVEDFGTNPVYGVRAAYHITQTFFAEASAGTTDAGLTSFEELSGAATLLEPDQRTLTYYNMSFGVNLFPGEVFLGKRRAFNSALYLTGGAGSTQFAGDSRFTVSVGLGYRFFLMDWLAMHADVRNHVFDIDLLGEPKTTNNIEAHAGFTFFF